MYELRAIAERLRALEIEVSVLRRAIEAFGARLADTGYMQAWVMVQLTQALTSGGSATARFWAENDDGTFTLSDADTTITVYSPKYHKSLTFASGKDGIALRWYKRWWWIGGECPT